MSGTVTLTIDGRPHATGRGTSVAVALLDAGVPGFRASVNGEPRGPVCGMGICFECRVTIDGQPHQRACLITCEDGMTVRTGVRADA